jgi:hypothetical protein
MVIFPIAVSVWDQQIKTYVAEPAYGYITVCIILISTFYCVAAVSYLHNTEVNWKFSGWIWWYYITRVWKTNVALDLSVLVSMMPGRQMEYFKTSHKK